MRAVKFVVLAVAALALLTAPADAAGRGKGGRHAADQQTAEQKKKAAEAEKAYQATLKQMPDQKFDPWAKMR
jgi:hypothetical protein